MVAGSQCGVRVEHAAVDDDRPRGGGDGQPAARTRGTDHDARGAGSGDAGVAAAGLNAFVARRARWWHVRVSRRRRVADLTAPAAADAPTDPSPLTVVSTGKRVRLVAIDGFDNEAYRAATGPDGRLGQMLVRIGPSLAPQDTSDPARAWTTIATGVPADVHGVAGIETRRVAGVQGTIGGGDSAALAKAGYRVTAIDWSPNMVEQARARMASAGVSDRVTVQHLGIHQLERLPSDVFDAAYSNFGPLNCVPDLSAAARQIAARLKPGGVLIASVIGRVCPWELVLYATRGDWDRARIRFAADSVRVPLNGQTVWTRYYRPAEFEQFFVAAGFTRLSLRALGLCAPPP